MTVLPRQIVMLGDTWGACISGLESNNAELGRIIDRTAMRRQGRDMEHGRTFDLMQARPGRDVEGPTVRVRKCSKTGIQTVGEHWAATQAMRRDEDLRVESRETVRMKLGVDGRMTKKRVADKLVKVFVDPDLSVFDALIELINAKNQSTGAVAPSKEYGPAAPFCKREKRH